MRPTAVTAMALVVVTSGCSDTDLRARVELELAPGAVDQQAASVAPDPQSHFTSVVVEITPSGTPIDVALATADGATLRLLDADQASDRQTENDVAVCRIELPILEAREPGEWLLLVSRTGEASTPAHVTVDLIWTPVDGPSAHNVERVGSG